jgi:hypothetical protein
MRWFHDRFVGPPLGETAVMARFFISTAEDETPEIYFLPMNTELVARGDREFMQTVHVGDRDRNAIPLSQIDVEALYNVMVMLKAKLLRIQADYHRSLERPSLRIHLDRMLQSSGQVEAVMEPEEKEEKTDPVPQASGASLADLLQGW